MATSNSNIRWIWPDGSEHEQSYDDYLNSQISRMRIFYERLLFIFNKIHFLFTHFESIHVRKVYDHSGKGENSTDFRFKVKLIFKKIEIPVQIEAVPSLDGSCVRKVKIKSHSKGL